MAQQVESGANWRVERGVITPRLAAEAGQQAILLNGLARRGVVSFAHRRAVEDNPQRRVTTVDVPELLISSFERRFAELKQVFELTEEKLRSGEARFHIDSHDAGGYKTFHRCQVNPAAPETVSVSLIGRVEAFIKDPVEGSRHVLLEPTDAIYFRNLPQIEGEQPTENETPTYSVWPGSVAHPVALVNG